MADDLGRALERAWHRYREQAPPAAVARTETALRRAHESATARLSGQPPPPEPGKVAPQLAAVWSQLSPAAPPPATLIAPVDAGAVLPVHVSDDGQIWGIGAYEHLDPRWTEAFVAWLWHRFHRAPFRTTPQVVAVPDAFTMAVLGDWATGFFRPQSGASGVAEAVSARAPDVTVHLGDTYYAGDADELRRKLLDPWPAGRRCSVAVPGNHELFSGAHAYFDVALAPGGPFHAQKGTSYGALENRFWTIFALDSAYHADDMYEDGELDGAQLDFIQRVAKRRDRRRVLVLSHHPPVELAGERRTRVWNQVVDALGAPPEVWYWGHEHNGVVYRPSDGCWGRCVGHGAIPYARSSLLGGAPQVAWSETELAGDPARPERVQNGFAWLELDGPHLAEAMVSERGAVRWSARM
jgi:hypothetical protein